MSVAVLTGAILIHVVEFHLGIGVDGSLGKRLSAAGYVIEHCPLRVWIVVAVGMAAAALAAGTAPVHRDRRRLSALRREHAGRCWQEPRTERSRLDLRLFLGVSLAVTLTEWLIFGASLHAMPMDYAMKMNGSWMVMSMTPPIPVPALCAVVGVIVGVILALCERKIAAIASLLEALARMTFGLPQAIAVFPTSVERPTLPHLLGPALFSRPPPVLDAVLQAF